MESDSADERRALLQKRLAYNRSPSSYDGRRRISCVAILLTQTLERIAFYGISGNLVLFLNLDPLLWISYNAVNALAVFSGTSYVMALVGGGLGDTFGRYRTICIAFLIYIVGYSMFPLIYPYPDYFPFDKHAPLKPDPSKLLFCNVPNETVHNASYFPTLSPIRLPGDERCSWIIYLTLVVTGIGTGIVKANIAPFGADQVKQEGNEAMRVFFNWFYWCVNIGAFLALTVVVYVQQVISFFYGFVIPLVCLVLAAVIFIVGGCCAHHTTPSGSVLLNVFKVLKEAIHLCYKRSRNRRTLSGIDVAEINQPSSPSCLDLAKVRYGGSFHETTVEDVKALADILMVFAVLIPYWVVYFQVESTFLMQALHMNLNFNSANSSDCSEQRTELEQVPAASLSLFDVIFLLFLIPLMDRLIYPRLDRSGCNVSLVKRMCIGMIFSIVAVVTAGLVEFERRSSYNSGHKVTNCIGGTPYEAAKMNIFWQTPQYALIGVSEMFTSVAGLEFAYSQAPVSMKGVIFGLFWFSYGIGSFVGTATIYWFNGVWFSSQDHGNINCTDVCHMDRYYYFLGGVQAAGLLLFMLVIFTRFRSKTKRDVQEYESTTDISFKNNLQQRHSRRSLGGEIT